MVSRPRFAVLAICVSGFCGVTFTSKAPLARCVIRISWRLALRLRFGMALSVRHGRHLADECVLEPEVTQVPHPLWKEYAIQMVDFVLHHARVKALHRPVDGDAGGIEALVAQPPVARHEAAHAKIGRA